MTTLSDAIRAVVGGTSVNDGLKAYFAANGGVGTTLPDLERSFLISQLGLSAPVAATTNDLWRQFLVDFTGSLPDQLYQFWLAGGAVESWTPAEWFLAGEQGIWLDPSDMSTMFQDSAGTTPVTAVEQPVGKILDKSGRGNHASQATTAQKPVLSARKNLLLATTTLATQSVTLTASPHTLSFKGTGTVTLTGASTAGPLVGTGAGNRVSLTFTPTAGSVTFTVSGSVTEAQLENGSAFTTYQRVNTATDYDSVGFPYYLAGDGVDDGLQTANALTNGVGWYFIMASQVDALTGNTASGDTFHLSDISTVGIGWRASGGVVRQLSSRARVSGGTLFTVSAAGANGAFDVGVPFVTDGWHTGTVLGAWASKDPTEQTVAADTLGATSSVPLRLSGSDAPSRFYGGVALIRTPTPEERAASRAFFANKIGLTLP